MFTRLAKEPSVSSARIMSYLEDKDYHAIKTINSQWSDPVKFRSLYSKKWNFFKSIDIGHELHEVYENMRGILSLSDSYYIEKGSRVYRNSVNPRIVITYSFCVASHLIRAGMATPFYLTGFFVGGARDIFRHCTDKKFKLVKPSEAIHFRSERRI